MSILFLKNLIENFSLLVHEAVVQNNIPVVFFEGTGRCCNLFAKAFHLYNEYRHKFDLNGDTSK
jgi:hypothetical protein